MDELIKLEEALFALEENDLLTTVDIFIKTDFPFERDNFLLLCKLVITVFKKRPKAQPVIFRFCYLLDTAKYFGDFRQSFILFMSKQMSVQWNFIWFSLWRAVDDGFYPLENVIAILDQPWEDKIFLTQVAVSFFPQISKAYPAKANAYFQNVLTISKQEPNPSLYRVPKTFVNNFHELSANHWKKFIEWRSIRFSSPPLSYILQDDVDSLQKYSIHSDFSFSQRIMLHPQSLTDPFLLESPTLLSCAAFFGSVRCARFLLLNGASLDAPLGAQCLTAMQAAVAGGSTEIIHDLEEYGASFENTLKTATQYVRNDILNWLIEFQDLDITKEVKIDDATKNINFRVFLMLLPNDPQNDLRNDSQNDSQIGPQYELQNGPNDQKTAGPTLTTNESAEIWHSGCLELVKHYKDRLLPPSSFILSITPMSIFQYAIKNFHIPANSLYWTVTAGDYKRTAMLLKHGAKVNELNIKDENVLFSLPKNNQSLFIRLLAQYHIDFNQFNTDGETALMKALKNEDMKLASELVSYGADLEICNKNGKSAKMMLSHKNWRAIQTIL